VTPVKRGKGNKANVSGEPPTPAEHGASMTWAQRLKRVFPIDIEICRACGGADRLHRRLGGDPEDMRSPEGKG
jgi:hypothetical protein